LKDLRDNKNSTGIATVFGPEIVGCSTRDQMASTTTTTQVPTKPIIDSKKVCDVSKCFLLEHIMVKLTGLCSKN
jgi:hypothetical protein